MPRSVLSRATEVVANRLDRRSFIARSALVGSALVTAPSDLLLRPTSAYAAVCSCQGQGCACGSLCCDGYTEFCCAIYGRNFCPAGSLTGGWWKADGSSFCGGAARYYMDCHKPCGTCSCGGGGVCSGACNGTHCGCGLGRCDHRKAGCTSFRYGNCNNNVACIGPIQCRVVTCTPPWQVDPSCSSSAVRTDNNTRSHNRPCLQARPEIHPVTGDWDGNGAFGIGFNYPPSGKWSVRQTLTGGQQPTVVFGRRSGDLPVVGDWNGDGRDSIGLVRDASWLLCDSMSPTVTRQLIFGRASDTPVVGDWNGDGADGIGVFRSAWWYLRELSSPQVLHSFKYGAAGDIPVTGDWNGDGRDGVGVFRRGTWYLRNTLSGGDAEIVISYGQAGDIPVVGDWFGLGADSVGVYRPSQGRWYLRRSVQSGISTQVVYGDRWLVG
ncbi:MAG: hypothetical protein ACJ739_10560 [Acidimicrobiales bacterium]